jgi:very-short-patch-repair endonuclease
VSNHVDRTGYRGDRPGHGQFRCGHWAAHKLVVEVDGGIHETQIEYDAARTTELEAHGYTIVRFTNEVVLHQLETVLAEILQAVEPYSVRDTG